MAQWWKNPESSMELEEKLADCTARAIEHEAEERTILADAARSKARIARAALNRKVMKPARTVKGCDAHNMAVAQLVAAEQCRRFSHTERAERLEQIAAAWMVESHVHGY